MHCLDFQVDLGESLRFVEEVLFIDDEVVKGLTGVYKIGEILNPDTENTKTRVKEMHIHYDELLQQQTLLQDVTINEGWVGVQRSTIIVFDSFLYLGQLVENRVGNVGKCETLVNRLKGEPVPPERQVVTARLVVSDRAAAFGSNLGWEAPAMHVVQSFRLVSHHLIVLFGQGLISRDQSLPH